MASPPTTGRDRGASLVEFALIVPLLVMFLFGIVQFGIAYDKKQSINSAAREGARTGAIPANDVSDITVAVNGSFKSVVDGSPTTRVFRYDAATEPNPDFGGAGLAAAERPCLDHEGEVLVVVASVKHELTIPFFGAPDITLTGKGEFRCERTV